MKFKKKTESVGQVIAPSLCKTHVLNSAFLRDFLDIYQIM